ncbi:hypothetical protein K466DRAFT_372088 [Polyporus arcularius HHB13444]|uniref:DUF6593 domain-containing protein n=2 Tax=Polyporaceae TaxID=5317 RepID=A0A5C3PLK2_9APHY|nr:hypothetical protein OH76DRAFT_880575 [Polyporus brumalis]TFK90635.1 hypothetical protein K466DRAFT_372088 [Polyporus arcularius HHB13444]
MPPAAKPKPPQKLEFTMNSLRNTTLATDDNSLYFEIVTRFWHPNLTKINKFDFETLELVTVAEIEGLQTHAPRVRFGGDKGNWISAADFLKADNEHASGGTFKANTGVEYRWKTHRGRFQLVKSDDPEKRPVAEFHPHKRHLFVFRMAKHAYFEVQPIPEITDAIEKFIVSYLLVERRRRDTRIRVKLERH